MTVKCRIFVNCRFCGNEIEITPSRKRKAKDIFCNRNCFANWRKGRFSGKNSPRWNSIEVLCDFCNKAFYIPNHRTKSKHHFCCKECFSNWLAENGRPSGKDSPLWNKIQVVCEYCSKKLLINPSKKKSVKHVFCSVDCHNAWQSENCPTGKNSKFSNRLEATCSFCEKQIEIIPYRYALSSNHFCDRDCFKKWKKEHSNGLENSHWNRKERICDGCGAKILVKKSDMNKKHQFCRKVCWINWMKNNQRNGADNPNWCSMERKCDYCNKKILVTPYRLTFSKNHFCNKHCFDKWSRIYKPRGSNSPIWKGGCAPFYGKHWINQKEKILERARYVSEISGNNGGLLDVHHIIPMRIFIQTYIELCLNSIPYLTLSSFRILRYDSFIPDLLFNEANGDRNLICVTRNEHAEFEGMPCGFFEYILSNKNDSKKTNF